MPGGWGGFARGWTKSDEDDPDVFTYPDKLLHELFYEQAAKTPDSVAVVDGDRSLTYAGSRTRRGPAAFLRKEGVKENAVVPIFMPRCLEFAVSYIAALSAGSARAAELADLLEKEKVTRMLFTPSLLEAVLDFASSAARR
ncbi:L-cystine transmembrane transporter [Aureococcus anophagefferens]|nr:L-cystine transmembrane transporter [Aureococcus anophagefferens]